MLRTRAGLGRVDAALKHATRRCPFLGANPGVLPPIEPKAAAPSVHPDALKLVASKCPVMAPVVHSPGGLPPSPVRTLTYTPTFVDRRRPITR